MMSFLFLIITICIGGFFAYLAWESIYVFHRLLRRFCDRSFSGLKLIFVLISAGATFVAIKESYFYDDLIISEKFFEYFPAWVYLFNVSITIFIFNFILAPVVAYRKYRRV
jgi:hypothetical protein